MIHFSLPFLMTPVNRPKRCIIVVKPPHGTLKKSVDDPLPGYVKDPKAPLLGNENNPHLIAMLHDDSNGKPSSNKKKRLTATETVCKCNHHASNGSGGYYVQQKDSQMGPSLRNLQEFVNQNQNTSRRIHTSKADTPHNSSTSSITYVSSQRSYQSYSEANNPAHPRVTTPTSPDWRVFRGMRLVKTGWSLALLHAPQPVHI